MYTMRPDRVYFSLPELPYFLELPPESRVETVFLEHFPPAVVLLPVPAG